jgi:hypothetical protein
MQDFLSLEKILNLEEDRLSELEDICFSDVLSEMRKEKSSFKTLAKHSKEFPYSVIISLLEYCSKTFTYDPEIQLQVVRSTQFLRNVHNIPTSVLDLILGYYTPVTNSLSLCNQIFDVFENANVEKFEEIIEEKFIGIDLSCFEVFSVPETDEYIEPLTLRDLLSEEENLYMVFAKHFSTSQTVGELVEDLYGEIGNSPTRLAILGFIARLPIIYDAVSDAHQDGDFPDEDFFTLLNFLLDLTLGKKVNPKDFDVFFRLGLGDSDTFGSDFIGNVVPDISFKDHSFDELLVFFKFLPYPRSYLCFIDLFMNNFSGLEEMLNRQDEPEPEEDALFDLRSLYFNDILCEMQKEKSCLKPFVKHYKEFPYSVILSLLEYYAKSFTDDPEMHFEITQSVRFLKNAPNVPTPVLNLIYGYYTPSIKFSSSESVKLISNLSDLERKSLAKFQPQNEISGISDPDCKTPQLILKSLLECVNTFELRPFYSLANFSLPFFVRPKISLREYTKKLKDEARKNQLIQIVSMDEVEFDGKPENRPYNFFERLEILSVKSDVLTDLFKISFKENPVAFKFFLSGLLENFFYETITVYYSGMDLIKFVNSFRNEKVYFNFFQDLRNAKEGLELGFNEIIEHFPKQNQFELRDIWSHKKNLSKWLTYFFTYFDEHIIKKGIKIGEELHFEETKFEEELSSEEETYESEEESTGEETCSEEEGEEEP